MAFRFSSTCVAGADVIVAGAGPAGFVLATLLSGFDVSVHLVEKRASLPTHPRAHFINHRSMEIFRPLKGLSKQVADASPPLKEWRKFIYSETVRHGVFGSVDHFSGQDTAHTAISPEPVAHLSQNRLLPMMMERGRSCENIQIDLGIEIIDCRTTKDGAAVTIKDAGGAMHEHLTKAVVIANGANSELVHRIGIHLMGTGVMQNLLSVHFNSRELAKAMASDPAMLIFVFNPEVIMVIIVHDLSSGEFVAQIPFFPPLQNPSEFGYDRCAQLISAAFGDNLSDLHIDSIRPWIMKAQVAETFQKGNVFIIGDAAHVFPPAGGFGMNTGIQDAHNLGWKLAASIKGLSPTAILSSYTRERRPIALGNSDLSVRNWEETAELAAALGLDPRNATLLNNFASNVVARLAPRAVAKGILEMGLDMGRRLAGNRGPLGDWRRKNVQKLFEEDRTLRLQFPAEDLGFDYQPVANGTFLGGSRSEPTQRRRKDLTEAGLTLKMGRRFPHAVVELGDCGRRVSTLDFVSCFGDLPTSLVIIRHAENRSLKPGRSVGLYLPFTELEDLQDGSYEISSSGVYIFQGRLIDLSIGAFCGSGEPRAVVVRPDGHVAQIIDQPTPDSLQRTVRNVFEMS